MVPWTQTGTGCFSPFARHEKAGTVCKIIEGSDKQAAKRSYAFVKTAHKSEDGSFLFS